MAEKRTKTRDKASQAMLEKAKRDGVDTAWDRYERMSPQCKFGSQGLCCRNCFMGPCRVIEGLPGGDRGVCGATASTIVARNFARMVAAGAAAHSDHGRGVSETLLMAATGKAKDYTIKDRAKLCAIAEMYEIDMADKSTEQIAEIVAYKSLSEFGKFEGEVTYVKRAPEARRKVWREQGVVPRAIDREITEVMHRTHIGVDQDYRSILQQASRCALGDGWGGSMIGTELQDILFGTPIPRRSRANLGVLREDTVNIIIHGHEPLLSEMIMLAAQEPAVVEKAKAAGAKGGITLAGMCCTANETLMRHGIPLAGNSMQQELALATGAVEAMVVDIQCIMQSIVRVAGCYHSKIITTSPKAHITGATHMEFDEHRALEVAREIVEIAIDNFQNRGKVDIPDESDEMIVGFSHETINYMLGGRFRASYRPLNDNIINGRIRGIVGVVGCNSPKFACDSANLDLVTDLIANDILVVQTGCMAIASAKQGLMKPELKEKAGPGLREICDTVGMPPVLHSGSCVDNSRILIACSEMVREGGLGEDISDLPVAGAAPEWMSEKAVSIGHYFVASGALVVFGVGLPITGSQEVHDYLTGGIEKELGGKWAIEPDPKRMAEMLRDHVESKRDALGINVKAERKLFDMADRRELEV